MRDLDSLDLDAQDLETLHSYLPRPPRAKKRSRWVRYMAVVLLGVVCVGGAELLACRFFEPVLYEELMEPVREKAHQAVQAAGGALEAVCRHAAALAERTGEAAAGVRDSFREWRESAAAPPEEAPEEDDSSLAQPDLAPPKDILDPLISDLVERDGREVLTGGGLEVVYYNQTDEAREGQMYGTDPLATHGCGPTAMAMAVSSLTGEAVDPEEMAKLCVKQGYWCRSHGSYLSMVRGVAEIYGLDCTSVDLQALDEDALYQSLSAGDVVVALMSKGHFTKGGHFILLRGTTLSGEILVADPASRDRSLIPWDLSLILDELSPSRHDGAPLWILSGAME